MKVSYLVLVAFTSISMISCVSSKKFKAEQARYAELSDKHNQLQNDLKGCEDAKAEEARKRAGLESEVANLNKQMEFLKENNTTALKQLQDLSVISSAQAESIKKSMDNLGLKDAYIQDLQTQMAKKDSLNMALVMNLKGAIGNLEDEDINIKVDKGVVYVDISDKLLFKSGSYAITPRAEEVLGKVAMVLKNQPDIEFMVEGHTDNNEVRGNIGIIKDNWDLSVMRATSVVKVLQKKHGLDPAKMAAAGRGEYKPVADNATAAGKAANRRTRIVILPQLDQFYKLLERK
ncbi:OmpA/MotB family protein [Flavihumibacter sp. UBA7668]|uniref:OmpA/MotB family protein n=1 Tax=Flavihumibacter sp. UBA7668 TaxID=1946542 RepID=UPI0025BD5910|nr:OmpA family protein [Flavihumibacter sp. UBA7668]